MKHIPFILILIFLISCSKDPSPVVFSYKPNDVVIKDTVLIKDSIEQCVFGEFYTKAIVNDKCWVTKKTETTLLNGIFSLNSTLDSNFIQHTIAIKIGSNFELGKIIFFDRYISGSDKRFIAYYYSDYDAGIGYFAHPSDPDSIHNFFIIDKINSDTSIIEGRFKATMPRIQDNINYKLPNTIVIKDGSFKTRVRRIR